MRYQQPLGADTDAPYIDGNPQNGTPGSPVPAAAIEHTQREIVNLIIAGELVPDQGDLSQLSLAVQAMIDKSLSSVSSGVPIGVPFFHIGIQPPQNAIELGGFELSRTNYPELWGRINDPSFNFDITTDSEWLAGRWGCYSSGDGITTFRVPETRGEFIRGWDNGRGVDVGRLIGEFQDHLLGAHDHARTSDGSLTVSRHGSDALFDARSLIASANDLTFNTQRTGMTGGNENRPRNISWMVCVNYQ